VDKQSEAITAWIAAGSHAGRAFRLRPPRRIRGRNGSQAAFGAGASLEFLQHRDYHPGDDPRDIDWNASARSDRLVSKLFRREAEPHLDLIIDSSSSMGTGDARRAAAATATAALLATAATGGGWSIATWLIPRTGPVRREKILDPRSFPLDAYRRGGNPGAALIAAPPRLRPGSLRIFLSDLMWPTSPSRVFDILSRAAEGVAVLRIVDREDSDAPSAGRYRLIDVEDGRNMEVEITAEIARRYSEAFSRHRKIWEEEAVRNGALYLEILSGIKAIDDTAESLAAILEPL